MSAGAADRVDQKDHLIQPSDRKEKGDGSGKTVPKGD